MIQDPPGPSGRSPATAALWTLLLAAVFFSSVLALLQIRAGAYDESFLLLGARLVRSGELPYVDFYTHYGPLGYTIVAAWSAISRNPGLALRSLQAVLLGAVLLLLVAAGRKKQVAGQRLLGFGGIAFGAFAVANVFRSGAFLGFALLMTALLMLVISQTSSSATAARLLAAAVGVGLVLAGLVRPVFAAYSGVAVAAVAAAEISASRANREARTRLLVVIGAALFALPFIWIATYRRISPAVALEASILGPGRLTSGGERFLNPRFLVSPSGSDLAGVLAGALVAVASASWVSAARSRSTRALALVAGIAGAIGTARLERSPNAASEVALLAGLLLLVGLLAVFRMRGEIADSPAIAAGGLFGVTALAFLHYFWIRADRAHLAPSVGLAAIAVAFVWPRLGTAIRLGVAATFLAIVLLFPQLPLRVPGQVVRGIPLWSLPWPAGTVPRDAADAVRFADEHSDPGSRFVAVASTHVVTSANPVMLFLLSSRRPYTRWYTYDPGVQDSPAVQEQMAEDLVRSGSRAAVVWDARLYVFEPRVADLARRTPFDEVFDRLYPIQAARFGEYEVRLRAEPPSR